MSYSWDMDLDLAEDLPICRYFVPRNCRDRDHRLSLVANGYMYHNCWNGVGTPVICAVFLMVAAAGLYQEYFRSRKECGAAGRRLKSLNQAGEQINNEDACTLPMTFDKQEKKVWNHAILRSIMHFWTEQITFTMPMLSFKIFLTVMISMDLLALSAPHLVPLATPELVFAAQGPYSSSVEPWEPQHFNKEGYLLPFLTDGSLDQTVSCLRILRTVILVSWSAFLLTAKFEGITYSVGAISYVYLAVLGHNYVRQNAMLPNMHFIFCSILAIPWIRRNPRAASWLRTSLLFAILLPVYFCAGLSKFRYMGVMENFSGSWIAKVLSKHLRKRKVSFPPLSRWVSRNQYISTLFSFGNLAIEIVMPLLLMMFPASVIFRTGLLMMAIGFHISILILMGANFMSCAVLCFLCMDPLSWFGNHRGLEMDHQSINHCLPSAGDWLRVSISSVMLALALRPAIISDWVHLMGDVPPSKTYDLRFPFSEWKMYARPLHPNFHVSLGLAILGIFLLSYSIFTSGRRGKPKEKHRPSQSMSNQNDTGGTAVDYKYTRINDANTTINLRTRGWIKK